MTPTRSRPPSEDRRARPGLRRLRGGAAEGGADEAGRSHSGAGAGRTPGLYGTNPLPGQVAAYSYDLESFNQQSSLAKTETAPGYTLVFTKESLLGLGKTVLGQKTNFDDLGTSITLFSEFGLKGTWRQTTVRGTTWIIFKGEPTTRVVFSASKYSISNTKIVTLAIGRANLLENVVQSGAWTIVAIGCWDILKQAVAGGDTADFLAELTTDLAKGVIGTGVAALAGVLATAAGGPVIVPIAATLIVGIVVGFGLDALDQQFGVTSALSADFQALFDAYHAQEQTWGEWLYMNIERPIEQLYLNAAGGY